MARIVIGRSHPAHHRIDVVAITLGIGEALEHHTGRALARRGTTGVFVKWPRHPVAGIGTQGIRRGKAAQITVEIHRASERDIEFAALQGAHRNVKRTQARRVFAANCVARPADVKLAGDPAGNDATEGAERAVGVQWQARLLGVLRRALLDTPAKMKIGGAQIKTEADEHAAA